MCIPALSLIPSIYYYSLFCKQIVYSTFLILLLFSLLNLAGWTEIGISDTFLDVEESSTFASTWIIGL